MDSAPPPPPYSEEYKKDGLHHRQVPSYAEQPRVIIVNAPIVFGRYPQRMQCTNCQSQIVTRTETVPNNHTHLIALLCCILFCFGPCVYLTDSCMGTQHYCPQCNALLGVYNNTS